MTSRLPNPHFSPELSAKCTVIDFTVTLKGLEQQLLERLSNSTGNLLDDTELIEVLANTKAKAKEVEGKLREADERTIEINEKREQFRPVATRGSIMYFNMVDMCNVINPITLQPSG